MSSDFFSLLDEARVLNSKIITLARLQILSILADFSEDGALYRELKASLAISDGKLISNLNALRKMRYIVKKEVKLENKNLDSYLITREGREALAKARKWMRDLAEAGG